VFSANIDFQEWAVVNLPGLPARGLEKLVGPQHIDFNVYAIHNHAKKHIQADMVKLVNLKVSHEYKTKPFARQSQSHDEANKYLQSGQNVTLAVKGFGQISERHGFASICNHSSSAPTLVVVEIVHDADHHPHQASSGLLRSGDRVMLKWRLMHQDNNRKIMGEETKTYRYLTTHRGGWRLKWTSKAPTRNGFFTLKDPAAGETDEVGMPLRIGSEIVLQHVRWPTRFVSLKRGGQTDLCLSRNSPKSEPLRIRFA
jgi:hypothetical protein